MVVIMYYDCWTMGGIPFFPLLMLIAIVYILYKLFSKDDVNSSLDTLNKRYAKGEIEKGEYDAIKKDIS